MPELYVLLALFCVALIMWLNDRVFMISALLACIFIALLVLYIALSINNGQPENPLTQKTSLPNPE